MDPDYQNLVQIEPISEMKAEDAQRRPRISRPVGWWPDGGTVVKLGLLIVAIIVLIGWLLTALNH